MTGQRYACAFQMSVPSSSSIVPVMSLSTRTRRSSITTWRSLSSASSSMRSERIRSDSRSNTVSSASEAKSS